MARILCINDNPLQVAMFADMLRRRGHHVVQTMTAPLDAQRLGDFAPDIVLVNLVRRVEALRSPIVNFYAEVQGASLLRSLPAMLPQPSPVLILTGIAVEEKDLPPEIAYAAFVNVPRNLQGLLAFIDQVATQEAPLVET